MSKYRKLMVLVALIAALTMLATMTGVSFAAGGGTTNGEEETTCVIGYVINHRELVVDGTKFDPQLSVMYEGDVYKRQYSCRAEQLPAHEGQLWPHAAAGRGDSQQGRSVSALCRPSASSARFLY